MYLFIVGLRNTQLNYETQTVYETVAIANLFFPVRLFLNFSLYLLLQVQHPATRTLLSISCIFALCFQNTTTRITTFTKADNKKSKVSPLSTRATVGINQAIK